MYHGFGPVFWGPPIIGLWFLFPLILFGLLFFVLRRGMGGRPGCYGGWHGGPPHRHRGYWRSFEGQNTRSDGEEADRRSENRAFETYRSQTLRRLEEEQQEFEAYLAGLRQARDKREFNDFIEMRRKGRAEL